MLRRPEDASGLGKYSPNKQSGINSEALFDQPQESVFYFKDPSPASDEVLKSASR